MQIELSKEVEEVLIARAQAQGKSVSEVLAEIVLQSRYQVRSRHDATRTRSAFDLDEYERRMRDANPNYDTADPYLVDWQAVKAEGRRY